MLIMQRSPVPPPPVWRAEAGRSGLRSPLSGYRLLTPRVGVGHRCIITLQGCCRSQLPQTQSISQFILLPFLHILLTTTIDRLAPTTSLNRPKVSRRRIDQTSDAHFNPSLGEHQHFFLLPYINGTLSFTICLSMTSNNHPNPPHRMSQWMNR